MPIRSEFTPPLLAWHYERHMKDEDSCVIEMLQRLLFVEALTIIRLVLVLSLLLTWKSPETFFPGRSGSRGFVAVSAVGHFVITALKTLRSFSVKSPNMP